MGAFYPDEPEKAQYPRQRPEFCPDEPIGRPFTPYRM